MSPFESTQFKDYMRCITATTVQFWITPVAPKRRLEPFLTAQPPAQATTKLSLWICLFWTLH